METEVKELVKDEKHFCEKLGEILESFGLDPPEFAIEEFVHEVFMAGFDAAGTCPKKYDISQDRNYPVTQDDWDTQQKILYSLWMRPDGLAPGEQKDIPPSLRLAVFPNRMREGEVFIAEDKPIEPLTDKDGNIVFAGVFTERGFEQRPYFPPTPKTDWMIHQSINETFASEIVRRWNLQAGEKENG